MTSVQKLLHESEEKMKKTVEAVQREFTAIRTGRASTNLVEGIIVNYYGSPTPLKQLASLSTPEPNLIVIQPWDNSIVGEVEKAILKSGLGITPTSDGKFIRIGIPHPTEERREELVKVVKRIAEDGRVSVRTTRRDSKEFLKSLENERKIPEDERFRSQDEIQKLTDKYIEKIDLILKDKEKEIMEV